MAGVCRCWRGARSEAGRAVLHADRQSASLSDGCSPALQLMLQEEKNAAQLLDDEDQPQFVPTAYDCLRRVSFGWGLVRQQEIPARLCQCTQYMLLLDAAIAELDAPCNSLLLPTHMHPSNPTTARCPPTPASSRSALSAAWTCTCAPARAGSASSSRVRAYTCVWLGED